jgi:rsbT co-antagonist protein RsbR
MVEQLSRGAASASNGIPHGVGRKARAPHLRPEEQAAMKEFWALYEPHTKVVDDDLRRACEEMPEFAPILRAMTEEQMAEQNRRGRALQSGAILEGRWEAYLTDLRDQGKQYAGMGITFTAWFELISAFRSVLQRRVLAAHENPRRAALAAEGMNRFLDIAMAAIGEAYVEAKQEIILGQQQAIRELSTPVLQVRDRLLIIPLVGVLDTHRARQLTETALRAVREKRARCIVMDITGVPIVDSKVANHLLQTVSAARLMGATVIVTGLSADVAQSLVALGIDLERLTTVGDLQGGLEEAEKLLGYRVFQASDANRIAPSS